MNTKANFFKMFFIFVAASGTSSLVLILSNVYITGLVVFILTAIVIAFAIDPWDD